MTKKVVVASGLDEAFNITDGDTPAEIEEKTAAIDEYIAGDMSDADFIRTELKNNITTAKTALTRALEIQGEDEKARNTEVISDLVDTINSCLSQLISLNKIEADISIKKSKLDGSGASDGSGKRVTNNILIANTSDIIEKITDEMKKS